MSTRTRFAAIGTEWEIETARPLPRSVRVAVDQTIAVFDREWSRFRDDSVVASLAEHGGTVSAPADTVAMLDVYAALSAATSGAVDPLVAAALEHLGYDRRHSLRPRDGAGPSLPPWRSVVRWTDTDLSVAQPALLDVGAIGKGRLVDRVADVLRDAEIAVFVVDAGGDMAVQGASVRVGLEHPFDPRKAIGVVEVTDGAVAASAVNRRAWGSGLHHVLDARTGEPVRTVAASWAFGRTVMAADAISTALFFDGGARLAHQWGVAWVRMLTDGRVERSPGCPAELFTSRDGPSVA